LFFVVEGGYAEKIPHKRHNMMRRLGKSILVALGLVLTLVLAAWAGSYSFVDIDYPGIATTLNDIRGLNNRGQIVGSYTLGGRQ
jgi:hypothetical protein